jgi:hypothetical protein
MYAGSIQEPRGRRLDGRDHRGHPGHAERAGCGLAQPGVRWLVQGDHRRLRPVAAGEQDLLGFRHNRGQRCLRHGGRERAVLAEDPLDIGMPRQDVIADRRGVEDRPLRGGRERRQHPERVGQELGRQRVEASIDRAARCQGWRRHRDTSGMRPVRTMQQAGRDRQWRFAAIWCG